MNVSHIFRILLNFLGPVFLLTVLMVAVLRWINSPVTVYIMETRPRLSDMAGHRVSLPQQ